MGAEKSHHRRGRAGVYDGTIFVHCNTADLLFSLFAKYKRKIIASPAEKNHNETFGHRWLRDQSRSRLQTGRRDMPQLQQPSTHSTKPNEIKRPPCLKCKRPMDWHSVETVQAYYGPKSVQIFECENCGRLAAIA
jgi:hypothetical protein